MVASPIVRAASWTSENAVIILTTNLGIRDVVTVVSMGFQTSEDTESNYERSTQKVNDELKQHFRQQPAGKGWPGQSGALAADVPAPPPWGALAAVTHQEAARAPELVGQHRHHHRHRRFLVRQL
jgi:hypothetical protein